MQVKLTKHEVKLLQFAVWLKEELGRVTLSVDIDHEHLTKAEAYKILKKIKKEIEKC